MLAVAGSIDQTNAGDEAHFDRTMLEKLGIETVTTSTPWTDGVPVFTGIRLADLLKAVGAEGTTIRAVALNDYAAELPLADAETWNVILAFKQDGKTLTVRDKGPLWIVYPRDEHPELQSDKHNDKWVWQLKKLVIE